MIQKSFNIASLLEKQAQERPFQHGVVFPEGRDQEGNVRWTHLTYEHLNQLADAYAHGLLKLKVQPGFRVSLLVKPRLEFIPLVFALFKLGAIPVLIDPGMGAKPFLQCIKRMEPEVLIAEPIVHALSLFARPSFQSVKSRITMGKSTWWWGGSTLRNLPDHNAGVFDTFQAKELDEAAILFTSGSTGPAKGVTYTHGIFHAQARHIQDMYQIQPGERDLACFPLFGLFSMAIGMTVVIPEMDPSKPALADPHKLIEAIQTQGCTSAFGSPAIWKNVAKTAIAEDITLPSLKRILMAGAAIPVWMHEAFNKILPEGAELHSPYGATESLPVASIGSREILADTQNATRAGAGTCVGKLAPGIELKVIKITDEPIPIWNDDLEVPTGTIGELCVRGKVVTLEYKNEPHHTTAAKIQDGETIFHRMGDVGYLDEKGRVWFCGRKKHRVKTKNGELYTIQCEAIFNEHPHVYRSALVAVAEEPIIIIELEPDSPKAAPELIKALLLLGESNPKTAMIKKILFHDSFPVDIRHNAKIRREELALWAENKIT